MASRCPSSRKDGRAPARIVAIYAVVAAVWIYASDTLLGVLLPDPAAIVRFSVWKGLAFIAVTVCLLHYLIAGYTRQCQTAEASLERLNRELEQRVTARTIELEKSEESLREAYRELESKTEEQIRRLEELRQKDLMLIQQNRLAAMGEVLNNIAHHWRQPLNVLGLCVQEIGVCYEHGDCNRDMVESNISKTMATLRKLSQTIDSFRELSEPDGEKRLFSVNLVVDNTLSVLTDAFSQHSIAIAVDRRADPQITGYPNEFSLVLFSILMNAKDAFEERSVKDARVTVRTWAEQGRAVLTVTDNAGGIAEGILDRVFDAFFTTKQVGKGTGLNLFMAKNIIEKSMGGRIAVRNVEGGAEFRIEL